MGWIHFCYHLFPVLCLVTSCSIGSLLLYTLTINEWNNAKFGHSMFVWYHCKVVTQVVITHYLTLHVIVGYCILYWYCLIRQFLQGFTNWCHSKTPTGPCVCVTEIKNLLTGVLCTMKSNGILLCTPYSYYEHCVVFCVLVWVLTLYTTSQSFSWYIVYQGYINTQWPLCYSKMWWVWLLFPSE